MAVAHAQGHSAASEATQGVWARVAEASSCEGEQFGRSSTAAACAVPVLVVLGGASRRARRIDEVIRISASVAMLCVCAQSFGADDGSLRACECATVTTTHTLRVCPTREGERGLQQATAGAIG